MDYEKAVGEAFAYARHSKAVLAYVAFIAAAGAVGILVLSILFSRFGLRAAVLAFLHSPASLTAAFAGLIAVLAVLLLGILALNGTVIRNCAQKERLSESWRRFSPSLGSLVAVLAIAGLVSFGVNLVFDWLASAFPIATRAFTALDLLFSLALAFFMAFAEYAVVLEGAAPLDAIRRSVGTAWARPWDVLLAIVVASGTGLIITLATVVALILLAIPIILFSGHLLAGPLGILALAIGCMVLGLGVFFGEVMKLHLMAHAFLDLHPQADVAQASESAERRIETGQPKVGAQPGVRTSHRPQLRMKKTRASPVAPAKKLTNSSSARTAKRDKKA